MIMRECANSEKSRKESSRRDHGSVRKCAKRQVQSDGNVDDAKAERDDAKDAADDDDNDDVNAVQNRLYTKNYGDGITRFSRPSVRDHRPSSGDCTRISRPIHDSLRPEILNHGRREFALDRYGVTSFDQIADSLPLGDPRIFGRHHRDDAFERRRSTCVNRLPIVLKLKKAFAIVASVDFELIERLDE